MLSRLRSMHAEGGLCAAAMILALLGCTEGSVPSVDLGHSTVVVDRSTNVVADGIDFATVTVTLHDANDAPIPHQLVQLTSTGHANTLLPPMTTDRFGVAKGTIASTVAELKTLSAVVTGRDQSLALAQRPTVEFIAGPPAILAFVI